VRNRLPDHFIRAQQKRLRNRDVESLRRFHVCSQLELASAAQSARRPTYRLSFRMWQAFMDRVLVEQNVRHRFTELPVVP
jgi:hypothetical protein